jgi:hypothetical protein
LNWRLKAILVAGSPRLRVADPDGVVASARDLPLSSFGRRDLGSADSPSLPSDHYLKLVGAGGKLLRGDLPLEEESPALEARKK